MGRRRGDHKFVCDIDGQVYRSKDKRITWDGKVVHYRNYYTRPMSDFRRAIKEDTSVPYATGDEVLIITENREFYLWDGTDFVIDEDGNNIQTQNWPNSGNF